jgi:RHH-type transcriptional regulator, rel operon repressor / antitoxin RelB
MPTSVRLSAEVEARLDSLARRTGRSKAYYLRTMVEREIDQVEREFDLLARAEEVRAGRAKTVSLDEVAAELDLED